MNEAYRAWEAASANRTYVMQPDPEIERIRALIDAIPTMKEFAFEWFGRKEFDEMQRCIAEYSEMHDAVMSALRDKFPVLA